MLKYDGWYDLYTIEEKKSETVWGFPDYKIIGYPKSFEPEGKCFSLTGIPGTFSVVQAYQALKKLRKDHPQNQYRLLFIMVSQQTKIIEE